MYVCIIGPNPHGDQTLNVRAAIEAADAVIRAGHSPYCPHLWHFHHQFFPHTQEEWLLLNVAWLDRCDAVIRLPGEFSAAETLVSVAQRWGIPVYYGIEEFLYGKKGLRRGDVRAGT